MSPEEQYIKEIIAFIDDAVNAFQDKIPGIQDKVFDELQNLTAKLERKGNNILATTANLRTIGGIKNKIQKIIMNSDYLEANVKFIKAFLAVEELQNNYFKAFNARFTPKKTFKIIRELAVESTTNALLDQGLAANITDKITNILKQNITASVSIAELNNQLRDHILNTASGEGSLLRYTKQITTDSINQYSAQYNDAVAHDIGGMDWGRYVGSNLTTTREFCEFLTKKQWVHRTELPDIIKGHIDGHSCKLNKKTALPQGMIAGTNANNFNVYRGGYNCGHQWFWVPNVSVPDIIKERIK
jgi:hypothetical protein